MRLTKHHGLGNDFVIALEEVNGPLHGDAALARASQTFAIYGQLPSYRAMLDLEGAAGPADIAIVGSASEVCERVSA